MSSAFVSDTISFALAAPLVVIAISFGARALIPIDSAPAPATSVSAPAPATSVSAAAPEPTPPSNDYDLAKRNRQIDWCRHHKGIPAMTFWRDRSNVLCLRPEAVIDLPVGEPE